jgi:hypothetical protein
MKRYLLFLVLATFAFALGVVNTNRWNRWKSRPALPSIVKVSNLEKEWPLTSQLVSRSLQTHTFTTKKLERNSEDEIVWRWLKDSIQAFPQNWVKLTISEDESYGVVLYRQEKVDDSQLEYYNLELKKKGLPPLQKGKRYQRVNVHESNIICPSWQGLIDVEEAKLVYFEGESA